MAATWRRNDGEARWELGYYSAPDLSRDDPGGAWHWAGYITDEFMARTLMTTEQQVVYVWERFGSVPPPLAGYLPPEPPIVIAWEPEGNADG